MNNISSFYDELDLKYPEIAICVERIDRLNPGNPKFIIPVLTPNMSIDNESSQSIRQNTSNLRNGDISPEITDITMSNYMKIPLPKELCGNYDSKFLQAVRFLIDTTISCSSSNSEDYHSCNGTLNKKFNTLYQVLINMTSSRYIKKGSKWIVVFVGGDVTKPRIIAPYEHLPEEG
jgi:hypothetical protein